MRHAILDQNKDVPDGFRTYSLLLIPSYEWFQDIPSEHLDRLFQRFKVFGENLGKDHLAFWYYTSGRKSYGQYVDTVVTAAIVASLDTKEKVDSYINESFRGSSLLEGSGYDIRRARLICATYDLDFGKGPYIAFYPKKPNLPNWEHNEITGSHLFNIRPTKPLYILRFGGLDLNKSLALLDELESHILAEKQTCRTLSWKQFWLKTEQWCENQSTWAVDLLKNITVTLATEAIKRI